MLYSRLYVGLLACIVYVHVAVNFCSLILLASESLTLYIVRDVTYFVTTFRYEYIVTTFRYEYIVTSFRYECSYHISL